MTYCEKISHDQVPVAGEETLHAEQLLDEIVMLGLRSEGIDFRRVKEQLGVDLLKTEGLEIERLLIEKLAILEETTLRLTAKGMMLCDEISQLLLTRACTA